MFLGIIINMIFLRNTLLKRARELSAVLGQKSHFYGRAPQSVMSRGEPALCRKQTQEDVAYFRGSLLENDDFTR